MGLLSNKFLGLMTQLTLESGSIMLKNNYIKIKIDS